MSKFTYIRSIRDALELGIADSVSKRKDGTIVIRRGFYYRHGKDAQDFALAVGAALKKAGVEYSVKEFGEKYTTFRGGASLASQSHWWVELWPMVDTVG